MHALKSRDHRKLGPLEGVESALGRGGGLCLSIAPFRRVQEPAHAGPFCLRRPARRGATAFARGAVVRIGMLLGAMVLCSWVLPRVSYATVESELQIDRRPVECDPNDPLCASASDSGLLTLGGAVAGGLIYLGVKYHEEIWSGIKWFGKNVLYEPFKAFVCLFGSCDDSEDEERQKALEELRNVTAKNTVTRDEARSARDSLSSVVVEADAASAREVWQAQAVAEDGFFGQPMAPVEELAQGLERAAQDAAQAHNRALSRIDDDIRGNAPEVERGEPPSDPQDVEPFEDESFQLRTPRGTEAWKKLVDVKRYYHAAEAYAAATPTRQAERRGILLVADLGIQAADVSYVDGDAPRGDSLLDAATALIDTVFEAANDAVTWIRHTRAANFLSGVYHGAFGLPAEPTQGEGNEEWFYRGEMTGAGAVILGDLGAIAAGMTAIGGGAALAVTTGGFTVAAAATAVQEGLGLMAAGGARLTFDVADFREAHEQYLLSTGGSPPVRAGQAGEAAVRAVADIGPKMPIQMPNGRFRIPDGLTEDVLTEVKNVKYQAFTRQLRDFADYARANGLEFQLWVRRGIVLSKELSYEISEGRVILQYIP